MRWAELLGRDADHRLIPVLDTVALDAHAGQVLDAVRDASSATRAAEQRLSDTYEAWQRQSQRADDLARSRPSVRPTWDRPRSGAIPPGRDDTAVLTARAEATAARTAYDAQVLALREGANLDELADASEALAVAQWRRTPDVHREATQAAAGARQNYRAPAPTPEEIRAATEARTRAVSDERRRRQGDRTLPTMTPEQAAVVRRAGDAAHNAATSGCSARPTARALPRGADIGAHDESARPTYFNGLRAQALADVTNLATDSDDDLRRALAWLQIQADALEPLRAAMTGDPPALEQATQRANALLARLDPLPPDDQFGIHVRNGQFARAFSAEYDRLVAPLRAQAETAAAAAEFAPEDHQRYADLLALYRHRGTLRSRMGAAAIEAARHALTDAYGAHLAAGGARTEAARQRIVQLGLTPDQIQLVDDIGDEAAALVTTQARGTVADAGLALGGLAHLGALAAGIANAPPPQPAAQRATTFATLLLDPAGSGRPDHGERGPARRPGRGGRDHATARAVPPDSP